MQDLHTTTTGAAARFLPAGDRRLRPHNHQSLKCPRCDSPNTKFCYYNNYNLSQPRHFCKSCRRYWTKGGVLRNVPVGGGCRKSKRAKIKNDDVKDRKSSEKSSSSESSSLTAAVTEEVTVNVTVNTVPTSNNTAAFNYPDSSFFNVNNNQSYLSNNQQLTVENDVNQAMDGQIFAAEMGSFTSLINSTEKMTEFDVQTAPFGVKENPTVEIGGGMRNDGFGAVMDWGTGGGDQGLFDLTAGVDPSYWSQTQWTDTDQSLNYLP